MNEQTKNQFSFSQFTQGGDFDVESFLVKNKMIVFTVVFAIIALISSYFVFQYKRNASNEIYNGKIQNFETQVLVTLNSEELIANAIEQFKKLKNEVGTYRGLVPTSLAFSDKLALFNKHVESADILQSMVKNCDSDYCRYFVFQRLAVSFENAGNIQGAISQVESLNKLSFKGFEGKNYLDLGRLYLKSGDKAKAKVSFQYVVEKAKEDQEFVKLAKIYLSREAL